MLVSLIKKIRYILYNIKNQTKIHSIKADLRAKYGKGVLISGDVVVTNDVEIGDYSYVNRNSSVENCSIGKYCSISSGVWICPYEHPLNLKTTHPSICSSLPEIRERVIIGNDVLISLNAIILSGVKIGNGAVIGAGAVVTHDVPPYSIQGGVPSKHIKWRFNEEIRNKLLEDKWWEYDIDAVKDNKSYFLFKSDNISK